MIRQILLLSFIESFTPPQIEVLFELWQELKSIPGVVAIETGQNVSTEGYDKGFTHAAIVTFAHSQAVTDYLADPRHVKFANKLNPVIQDIIIIDIELPDRATQHPLQDSMADVPSRKQIKIGSDVLAIEKINYANGTLTRGKVARILTNKPFHPRGIKVKLDDGTVARVQRLA